MKHVLLTLGLALVAACHSQPKSASQATAQPTRAPAPGAVVDLSACRGKSMSVEEFVKACQKASGFNFTYAAPVQTAMASQSVQLGDVGTIAASEFQGYVDTQLEPAKLHCKRIGPDHLNVFVIERRADGSTAVSRGGIRPR